MKTSLFGRCTVAVMMMFVLVLVGGATALASCSEPAPTLLPARAVTASVTPTVAAIDGLQAHQFAANDAVARAVDRTPASPGHSEIPAPLKFAPFLIGMTALAKDRNTPKKDGRLIGYPIAAAKKIYAGSLVVLSAGYAAPGSTALSLKAVGRANETVDNSAGAAGDKTVAVERGVFLFAQDSSIAQADVGATCYIVDDQTVTKTDGSGTRSAAGTIRGVEAGGVWVEI